jgi:lipid-A-disaccharide synthase
MNEQAHNPLVMLVAGEASGDQHAASLFVELKKRMPAIRAIGMGSSKMRAAGVDIRFDSSAIGVIGVAEVIRHYGEIRRALRQMKRLVKDERPDLLVCVDYKEFNFQLAKYAKSIGVKVLFYVSPQVWAWRPGRVKKYGKAIDHMAVIFPFEQPFYESYRIPVTYVGHPLAGKVAPSADKATLMREFGLDPHRPVIGLLPGSRTNEIKRLLPVIRDAAALLAVRYPDAQFVLSQAATIDDSALDAVLASCPVEIRRIKARNHDVLACCDAAVTVSGTATLEVALSRVPMLIIYKVAPLTYWLGRWLINIPFIGMPNIMAGRSIVRELIQHDASGQAIADEVGRILDDKEYANQMRRDLDEVSRMLGEGGGSANLADLACSMLEHIEREQ